MSQGVRNIRFSENLVCFVFLLPPFWDSHFYLITDDLTYSTSIFKTWLFLFVLLNFWICLCVSFFYLRFISRTLTIHRTSGEWKVQSVFLSFTSFTSSLLLFNLSACTYQPNSRWYLSTFGNWHLIKSSFHFPYLFYIRCYQFLTVKL